MHNTFIYSRIGNDSYGTIRMSHELNTGVLIHNFAAFTSPVSGALVMISF